MVSSPLLSPSQNTAPEPQLFRNAAALGLPQLAGQMLWRANELGSTAQSAVVPSGFTALDNELPGGGWPCRALTEVLQPQSSLCEWRLLGPCLRRISEQGGQVILVSPPKPPHMPGLLQHGLRARQIVWLNATTPAERLWATEQLIKSNPHGAVLAWLPQVRPEQLRRLQVHAQSCDSPVFLFRPASCLHDASPAPLRLLAEPSSDWQLQVRVFKRRGPPQDNALSLFAITDSLRGVLTPRQRHPSPLPATLEPSRARTLGSVAHAVDRSAFVH